MNDSIFNATFKECQKKWPRLTWNTAYLFPESWLVQASQADIVIWVERTGQHFESGIRDTHLSRELATFVSNDWGSALELLRQYCTQLFDFVPVDEEGNPS